MTHDSLFYEHRPSSQQAQAKCQVHILKITKVSFVKTTY